MGGRAKRRFEVIWSGRCFVMAESASAAEEEAAEAVRDDGIGAGSGVESFAREWSPPEAPPEWENAIPWGGDDDRTVGEILRAKAGKRDA